MTGPRLVTPRLHPRRGILLSEGTRMASKGLRVASECQTIGPWERTVQAPTVDA